MPERNRETPVETVKEAAQQAAKAETSPPLLQRYRAVLFQVALVSALVIFALLTFLVKTTPSFPIDIQITRAIQTIHSPFFAGLMAFISWPGFLPQSMIIILIIAFALYMFGLHWESLTSLLAAGTSSVINELVKQFVQRPRPAIDLVDVFAVLKSYSFPSAHVMFYMSFFGFIWYVAYTMLKQSLQRSVLLGFLGGFIILVGVSRIYLGQHWASDVMGAYLLGGLILAGIIFFHRWGKKRFFLHQPVMPYEPEKE